MRVRWLAAVAGALLVVALIPAAAVGTGSPEGARPGSPDIVGGVEVSPQGKYPFMVALMERGGGSWYQVCGGALISDTWVLTAAHCTVGIPASRFAVVVGAHDWAVDGELIEVAAKFEHPDYGDPKPDSNDAALLQLSQPATLGGLVGVARPGDTALYPAGTLATVAGWGDTRENGGMGSDVLREVDLPIVSDAQCAAAYGWDFEAGTMVCAGYDEGGRDSCQGDSGGPLFIPNGNGYLHIGVVSFGDGCARPGLPGVYAETAALYSWIASTAGLPGLEEKPDRPRNLTAAPGDGRVTLSWDAPASDGGAPITDYIVKYREAGTATWRTFRDGWDASTSATVTGLANGTAYEFRVAAKNRVGRGPFSAWATATPGGGSAGNDMFASAVSLPGDSGTTTGTNAGATTEPGEPPHGGHASHSVWWTWTAPGPGTVVFNTQGSDFDTVLGVYQGGSVGSLTEVAFADDSFDLETGQVSFSTTARVIYRIAVDGYGDATGDIALNWSYRQGPPGNDSFGSAIWVTGASGTTTGTNVNATVQSGEPSHGGHASNSVWWQWRALSSESVSFDTSGSGFDTVLAVYRGGSSLGSLTEVAVNDDSGSAMTSRVVFDAIAGSTYWIAVDGYGDSMGPITLSWQPA